MEVGYAAAVGVPIFSAHAPSDLTLQQYVTTTPTLGEALRKVRASARPRRHAGLLIDPHASVEEAHHVLEGIEAVLTRSAGVDEPARRVCSEMADLQTALRMPNYKQ
jgi:hypothetical protein